MENRGCDVAKKYGVSFVVTVVPPFLIPYFPPTVFFPLFWQSAVFGHDFGTINLVPRVFSLDPGNEVVAPSFSNLSLLWTGDTFDQKSLNFVKSNLIKILNINYA